MKRSAIFFVFRELLLFFCALCLRSLPRGRAKSKETAKRAQEKSDFVIGRALLISEDGLTSKNDMLKYLL